MMNVPDRKKDEQSPYHVMFLKTVAHKCSIFTDEFISPGHRPAAVVGKSYDEFELHFDVLDGVNRSLISVADYDGNTVRNRPPRRSAPCVRGGCWLWSAPWLSQHRRPWSTPQHDARAVQRC